MAFTCCCCYHLSATTADSHQLNSANCTYSQQAINLQVVEDEETLKRLFVFYYAVREREEKCRCLKTWKYHLPSNVNYMRQQQLWAKRSQVGSSPAQSTWCHQLTFLYSLADFYFFTFLIFIHSRSNSFPMISTTTQSISIDF